MSILSLIRPSDSRCFTVTLSVCPVACSKQRLISHAKFRACVRRGVACRADQLSHQREDLAADYERLQVHATATSDAVRCAREVERGRAVKEAASNIPLDVLFQTGNVKSGVDAGHFDGREGDDGGLAAAREDRGS